MATHWERILRRSNQYGEMCETRAKLEAMKAESSIVFNQPSLSSLNGAGISVYAASIDYNYNPEASVKSSRFPPDRPHTSPSRGRAASSSFSSSQQNPSTSTFRPPLSLFPPPEGARPSTSPSSLTSGGGRPRLFSTNELGQAYNIPSESVSSDSRAVLGVVRGRPFSSGAGGGPLVPSATYLPDGSMSWTDGGNDGFPFDAFEQEGSIASLLGTRSGGDSGRAQSASRVSKATPALNNPPTRRSRMSEELADVSASVTGLDEVANLQQLPHTAGDIVETPSSVLSQHRFGQPHSNQFAARPGSGLSQLPVGASVLLPPSVGGWFSASRPPPPSRSLPASHNGGVGQSSSQRSPSPPGTSQRHLDSQLFADADSPTPLQRRMLADQQAHERKVALLNAREARAAKVEQMAKLLHCVSGWLIASSASEYVTRLSRKFEEAKAARANRQRQNAAATIIQVHWEKYFAPIRARKKHTVQLALMKFSFRLLAKLAVIRKRLAKKQVVRFYSDFSRQRFAFVMVKFRYNCVKLQRKIREHLECTRARIFVLNKLWLVVEGLVRDRVAMEVDESSGLSGHFVAAASVPKRLTGQTYPELAKRINKAMADAILLRKTINMGLKAVATAKQHVALFGEEGAMAGGSKMGGIGEGFIVPEALRLQILKTYLTKRRSDHGSAAQIFARSIDVKAKQVDVHSAGLILQGALDVRSHIDYTVKKHTWPMLMLYSVKKEVFFNIVQETVRDEIIRRNKALELSVKARLEEELKLAAAAAEEAMGSTKRSKILQAKLSRKLEGSLGAAKDVSSLILSMQILPSSDVDQDGNSLSSPEVDT